MLFSRWHAEHATPSSIEVGPCCRIADAMVIQTYVVPVHSGPPEKPPVVRPRGHGAARSTKDEGDDETRMLAQLAWCHAGGACEEEVTECERRLRHQAPRMRPMLRPWPVAEQPATNAVDGVYIE